MPMKSLWSLVFREMTSMSSRLTFSSFRSCHVLPPGFLPSRPSLPILLLSSICSPFKLASSGGPAGHSRSKAACQFREDGIVESLHGQDQHFDGVHFVNDVRISLLCSG